MACPSCGFRRSAKLWSPRPKNALGKKPKIPKIQKQVSDQPSRVKHKVICSRCHELVEQDEMQQHMLTAHVRVVNKRRSRRVFDIPSELDPS